MTTAAQTHAKTEVHARTNGMDTSASAPMPTLDTAVRHQVS